MHSYVVDDSTPPTKVTAREIVAHVTETGLEIPRDYRTKDEAVPDASLPEKFAEAVLTTDQIVLLPRSGQKGSP